MRCPPEIALPLVASQAQPVCTVLNRKLHDFSIGNQYNVFGLIVALVMVVVVRMWFPCFNCQLSSMHYEERSVFSPSLVWLFGNSPQSAGGIEVGICVAKSYKIVIHATYGTNNPTSSSQCCFRLFLGIQASANIYVYILAPAREPETSPERSLMRASIVRPEAWFCTS